MKNLKTKKFAIIFLAVFIVAAPCLYIFRTQSVDDIVAISKVDLSTPSITVFKATAGEEFTTVFESKDADDAYKIVELLSSAKAHLVEWKPLTGIIGGFSEGVVYVFMINDDADYNMLLDYSEGYVYYNNCKYRVSDEDVEAFEKGLEALCS